MDGAQGRDHSDRNHQFTLWQSRANNRRTVAGPAARRARRCGLFRQGCDWSRGTGSRVDLSGAGTRPARAQGLLSQGTTPAGRGRCLGLGRQSEHRIGTGWGLDQPYLFECRSHLRLRRGRGDPLQARRPGSGKTGRQYTNCRSGRFDLAESNPLFCRGDARLSDARFLRRAGCPGRVGVAGRQPIRAIEECRQWFFHDDRRRGGAAGQAALSRVDHLRKHQCRQYG